MKGLLKLFVMALLALGIMGFVACQKTATTENKPAEAPAAEANQPAEAPAPTMEANAPATEANQPMGTETNKPAEEPENAPESGS
ncbi:MAG: hypothetical protein P8Z49_11805 [Acidobacteriota bacterium]|jgi:hypothetical protein